MTYQKEQSLTDDLLSYFGKQSQAVSFSFYDIRKALGCDSERAQAAIDALVAQQAIKATLAGRYFSPSSVQLYQGAISATDRGFGFAVTENDERHFVPPPQMATLLTGDVVEFFLTISPKSGKPAAEVVSLVNRPETLWLGTVCASEAGGWLFASDEGLNPTFQVDAAGVEFADGDTIQVKVAAGAALSRYVPVQAILSLGKRGRKGFDIDYSLAKFQIPSAFSEAAMAEAAAFTAPQGVAAGRKDLRDMHFVTIDGEDSRDFDDALYAVEHDNGFTLRVAIADVSHYVQEGSALDLDARERATSVYYPGRVIPMLPEVLSNDLCSLNPGVERYALVAELEVTQEGELKAWTFYPASIRSHARLTYARVTAALEENASDFDGETMAAVQVLGRVHKALRSYRQRDGMLDFQSRDPYLVVVDDEIVDITWRETTLADAIVEDCMLAANRAAAAYLKANSDARLFRHHAAPQGEDWEKARETLARYGILLPEVATLSAMVSALEAARDNASFPVIEDSLRQSMMPAVYDVVESSHFSLAMPEYTHFSSPIRRYADLLVHRAIKGVLEGRGRSGESYENHAVHCGDTSRRADRATRSVWTLIKRRHLAGLIGTQYEAKALKSVPRGLKVVLLEWDCTAFVPAESFEQKGYAWDEEREVWYRGEDIEQGVRLPVTLVLSDEKEVIAHLVQ